MLLLIYTTPAYAQGSAPSGGSNAGATDSGVGSQSSTASTQSASSTEAGTTASTTQTATAPADETQGGPAGPSGQAPGMLANTGAATYSVPIQAPAGRGGIAPNLALAYNSDQGNGWVGLGWTLDMGAIQRSTKTPGGLTYSTSDQFVSVINGSVSNLVPNTNWGPGKYENEIDGAFLN